MNNVVTPTQPDVQLHQPFLMISNMPHSVQAVDPHMEQYGSPGGQVLSPVAIEQYVVNDIPEGNLEGAADHTSSQTANNDSRSAITMPDQPNMRVLCPESSPLSIQKRKTRGKTPVVDDEVRRSTRFKKGVVSAHVQLDKEPRKKKGATAKSVSISTVQDLNAAIVGRSLDAVMEGVEVLPIQAPVLVELGRSFCGVALEELNNTTLEANKNGYPNDSANPEA